MIRMEIASFQGKDIFNYQCPVCDRLIVRFINKEEDKRECYCWHCKTAQFNYRAPITCQEARYTYHKTRSLPC